MAQVITYDVEGVESSGGGGSVDPKPGVYPARIAFAEHREQKNDGTPVNDIRVALDLGGDFMWKFIYIGLDPVSDWKLAEFIRALELKDKGKLDLEKIKGKMIRVKLNPDTYEGEPTSKAGRLMRGQPDDVLPEPSGDDAPSENGAGPVATAEAGGSGYPKGYVPIREEDDNLYDDWSDEDLEGEVSDRGLTVGGGRGKKHDKLVVALRDDDENTLDSVASDEEPTAVTEDEYDDMDVETLESEIRDRELELPAKKRGSGAAERYKQALIDLLREDDKANPFDPNA